MLLVMHGIWRYSRTCWRGELIPPNEVVSAGGLSHDYWKPTVNINSRKLSTYRFSLCSERRAVGVLVDNAAIAT